MTFIRFLLPNFQGKSVLVILFVFIMLIPSCKEEHIRSDDTPVARVYNNYLYLSDIVGVIPPGISSQDSMMMARRFIDNWSRQQAFLYNALVNLDPGKMDFEKKISDYKNSLVIFTYETELVKHFLDTIVKEDQIESYYEEHQNQFKLQDNIVKVLYVKVPRDTPEIWRLRNLYRTSDPDELSLLEEYCIQHAANYLIDGETWLFFQDVLREMPINTNNPESFLRSNKYVELSDSYYRYFLHIQDYKLKGGVSPLVFERDNVRSILLNQRKHKFINERRDQYIQQAISDGQMEIFY
jgi:hypothetical protein